MPHDPLLSGPVLMANPFTVARRRAREELEQHLRSIFDRIERLESTPVGPQLKLEIEKHVAIQNREVLARLDAIESHDADLVKQLKELTLAIAEGIERVDRSERRVRSTVARAQKELKKLGYEDPGLEAEANQLRSIDGKGGTDGEVLDVPGQLDAPAQTPSSIRGVPLETLLRARRWS